MSAMDVRRVYEHAFFGATRPVDFVMPDKLVAVGPPALSRQGTIPVVRGRTRAGFEAIIVGDTALAEAGCEDPVIARAQLKPRGNLVERSSVGPGPRSGGQ